MNLYEIDKEILDCVDPETGEIIDPEKLSELQIERDTKIENVALWVKNLSAEAAALKEEANTFVQREKAVKAKIEGLKGWLTFALNGQNFNSIKTSITFRKSDAVEIEDESIIPEDYMRIKEVVEPDKVSIKDAIKNSHLQIPGCKLIQKQNIQIK